VADLAAMRAALHHVAPLPDVVGEARGELWDRYMAFRDMTDETDRLLASWLLVLQNAQTSLMVLASQLEDAIREREEVTT
jgi:hypothetical protein